VIVYMADTKNTLRRSTHPNNHRGKATRHRIDSSARHLPQRKSCTLCIPTQATSDLGVGGKTPREALNHTITYMYPLLSILYF